ncbi:MAG TPA: hypothetical protein VGF21_09605 [Thermoleophilaceae bacterium]|jgi:hypothetical protein
MRTLKPVGWMLIVLGVLMVVGGVAGGIAVSEARAGLLLGGVIGGASCIGGGWLCLWLGAGWDEPAKTADDIYKYGRPANAQVVEAGPVQQGVDGTATVKLKLHIAPLNESAIKTTQTVAIQQGRTLTPGEVVTVKFDPNDRKSFVLLGETYPVKDQFGNVVEFAAGAGAPA